MNKMIVFGVIAMAFLAAVPPTLASETLTAEYDIPSGPARNACIPNGVVGYPCALSTRLCASEWDTGVLVAPEDDAAFALACGTGRSALGRGDDGVVRMGIFSAALRSSCGDCYTTFLVSVVDTLPASTFYTFCIMTNNPDGSIDNTCNPSSTADPIPDIAASGCSTASLTSSLPAGGSVNHASAFVYATFVDENTGSACLGSSGSLVVSMS